MNTNKNLRLSQLCSDFALAMEAIDQRRPQAASHRGATRLYKPGIGPFAEDRIVSMILGELRGMGKTAYTDAGKQRYPGNGQICDLVLPGWAIEVKLAREMRDNGTYEPAAVSKILSRTPDDRSAVTDCAKLAQSHFPCKRAVLIFAFENPDHPVRWLIEAFEAVAAQHAVLGPRAEHPLRNLVHPIYDSGAVYAWQILSPVTFNNSPKGRAACTPA